MDDLPSHGAFVERAYEEACALLVDARDYIAGASAEDGKGLAPGDRLRLTLEMSRLTRRLTEVTAWLMLQKGVAAGEITRDRAATTAAAQMADGDPGAASDDAALLRLPLVARGLIDRARRLHAHVAGLRASLG
jgi:hypothetical protein